MRKIALILALCALAAVANPQNTQPEKKKNLKNERLCKVFQQKIVDYRKHMRDDEYAKATLASYKKRAAMFCGK